MMQTAEIETARPVIRIVDDDEVFLASQKFFFETFFPEVRVFCPEWSDRRSRSRIHRWDRLKSETYCPV